MKSLFFFSFYKLCSICILFRSVSIQLCTNYQGNIYNLKMKTLFNKSRECHDRKAVVHDLCGEKLILIKLKIHSTPRPKCFIQKILKKSEVLCQKVLYSFVIVIKNFVFSKPLQLNELQNTEILAYTNSTFDCSLDQYLAISTIQRMCMFYHINTSSLICCCRRQTSLGIIPTVRTKRSVQQHLLLECQRLQK